MRPAPQVALGIDPDLHSLAIAVLGRLAGAPVFGMAPVTVLAAGIVSVPQALKGDQAVQAMMVNMARGDGIIHTSKVEFEAWSQSRIAVVECQSITKHWTRKGVKPQDILRLGQVAGNAAGVVSSTYASAHHIMPLPIKWKGSVPKDIHQRRTLNAIGWGYRNVGKQILPPEERMAQFQVKPADWKHLIDAIGMALWALTDSRALREFSHSPET